MGQAVERVLHPPPVQVHLRRGRAAAERGRLGRIVLEDDCEPVVFVERERAQHDGVDDREDGRAGADPERQDRERDGGECRRLAQRPKGGLEVVAHMRLLDGLVGGSRWSGRIPAL